MDFYYKYSHAASIPNSLTHFIEKLKQKNKQNNRYEKRGCMLDLKTSCSQPP